MQTLESLLNTTSGMPRAGAIRHLYSLPNLEDLIVIKDRRVEQKPQVKHWGPLKLIKSTFYCRRKLPYTYKEGK